MSWSESDDLVDRSQGSFPAFESSNNNTSNGNDDLACLGLCLSTYTESSRPLWGVGGWGGRGGGVMVSPEAQRGLVICSELMSGRAGI